MQIYWCFLSGYRSTANNRDAAQRKKEKRKPRPCECDCTKSVKQAAAAPETSVVGVSCVGLDQLQRSSSDIGHWAGARARGSTAIWRNTRRPSCHTRRWTSHMRCCPLRRRKGTRWLGGYLFFFFNNLTLLSSRCTHCHRRPSCLLCHSCSRRTRCKGCRWWPSIGRAAWRHWNTCRALGSTCRFDNTSDQTGRFILCHGSTELRDWMNHDLSSSSTGVPEPPFPQ